MKNKLTNTSTVPTNHSKTIVATYKNGKSLKEIVPPIFTEARKMNNLINNEIFKINTIKEENNFLKPAVIFPEWPSEEEIEKFNCDQQKFHLEKFCDPDHESIDLPYSLLQESQGNLTWNRPSEYISDFYLTKEIESRFPLKNIAKFKKLIFDVYLHNECPIENKRKKKHGNNNNNNNNNNSYDFLNKLENNSEYTSENKRIFKTFFKIFDKQDYFIVKHREKEGDYVDSDSEAESSNKKGNKNNNNNNSSSKKEEFGSDVNNADVNSHHEVTPAVNFKNADGKLCSFFPRKILVEEKDCFFTKWISSVLQFIREFKISDDGEEPIWKKIYPQSNGIPFYNKNGRYWVKLHYMGKTRKIEIDDRIPCNRKMEPLVPKCHHIEELWPAIITKAILKLFYFKFPALQTNDCIIGDTQIIHALTGYYAEILKLDSDSESLLSLDVKKYFNKIEVSNIENNFNSDKEKEKEKNYLMFFNYGNNNNNRNEEIENIIESIPPTAYKKPGTLTNKFLPNIKIDVLRNSINSETDEILLRDFNVKRHLKNQESEKKRLEEIKIRLNMDVSDLDLNFLIGNTNKKNHKNTNANAENNNNNIISNYNQVTNNLNKNENKNENEYKDLKLQSVEANLKNANKTLKHSNSTNQVFESSAFMEKIKNKYNKPADSEKKNGANELEKIVESTSEEAFEKKLFNNNNNNNNFNNKKNIAAKKDDEYFDIRKTSDNYSTNFYESMGTHKEVAENLNNKKQIKSILDLSPTELGGSSHKAASRLRSNLNSNSFNNNNNYNKSVIISQNSSLTNNHNQNHNFNLSLPQKRNTIAPEALERSSNQCKRTSQVTGIPKPSTLNSFEKRCTLISEINKSFRGTIGKSLHAPAAKLPNNVLFGFCYPIVEAVDTKEFNMKRLKSFDLNDLKAKLHEAKNVFKKLGKDERKNYTQTIIELGNKFREIKNKRISEIKSKGKNLFLFKIANNCDCAQHLNIYCEFSEEEIDVVINCVINDWDFPPFEYYEKLANQEKTQLEDEKGKSSGSLLGLVNTPDRNGKKENVGFLLSEEKSKRDDKVAESAIIDSPTKKRMGNLRSIPESNFAKNNNKYNSITNSKNKNPNSNLQQSNEIKDFNPSLISNNNKNSSNNLDFRRRNSSSSNNHQLRRSASSVNIFEELSVMLSDEYLKDLYDELIFCQRDKYVIEKKAAKPKIKGQWIELNELVKSFNYFIFLFKNKNLKVKNNFDLNLQGIVKTDFYVGDKEHKVYFISLRKDKQQYFLESRDVHLVSSAQLPPPVLENNNANKKKQATNKTLIAVNNNNINANQNSNFGNANGNNFNENCDSSFNLEKKVDELHKILIEFSSTNGKNEILSDLKNFLVFDIYEVTENNHDNRILKCILENIQLSGFYDIFYKEFLKYDKDYLLYIKSAFTPLGYNIKICTESGFVEPMSYDRYLSEFGGMKNSASVKFMVPCLLAGTAFVIGKFSVKFNNAYFNNITNSNALFSEMANFIEFVKKDLIRIKFNVSSQEVNLIQFLNLYIFNKKQQHERNTNLNHDNDNNNLKKEFFSENKIVPINEIIKINLNEYELNDEIIFSLVFKCPYDVAEFALNADILTCCVDNLIITNIDLVAPYQIEDSVTLDRNFIVFKEIFYVPEKVYAGLFINIERLKSNSKKDITLSNNNNELEPLKEVLEENQDDIKSESLNTSRIENNSVFTVNNKNNSSIKETLSNKIRFILKIYKKDALILELDFFNDLLIPNLILDGHPVAPELNIVTQHNSAKKGKDPIPIEKPDYSKILTQYKIECLMDQSEIPKWLLNEKTLEWKIDVFASEIIGFVKDTTKEDAEKALISSWEAAQPGRADKAQKARIKFVEERKGAVDTYLSGFSPFKNLKPIDHMLHKAESMNNIVATIDSKILNMRESQKHKRNLSFNSHNLQNNLQNLNFQNTKEQAIMLKSNIDFTIQNKSKNINSNFSNFEKELNTLNNKSEKNAFSSLAANLDNIENKNDRKASKSVSAAALMEENVFQLNEKLKAASEFYQQQRNKSIDFDATKNEISSRGEFAKSSVKLDNNGDNLNDSRMHVSKYIKRFLHQAHEDLKKEEENDVFNMQNCKIHYKFNSPAKLRSKEIVAYESKKKNFFLKLMKNENEKIKTYYEKLLVKHNFKKTESQKVFEARNTFMTTINDNILKEVQLLEEVSNNFEINNFNNYAEMYRNLLDLHPLKNSSNLVCIHKTLSARKDQIISLMLERKEIKNKEKAHEILIDIKANNWTVSEKNMNAVISIGNAY